MLNASINPEKEKAGCLVGVGRVMGIRWCAGYVSMLLPCTPLNISKVLPYLHNNQQDCRIRVNSPCQGHSQLEVKSLKQAEVFDVR